MVAMEGGREDGDHTYGAHGGMAGDGGLSSLGAWLLCWGLGSNLIC